MSRLVVVVALVASVLAACKPDRAKPTEQPPTNVAAVPAAGTPAVPAHAVDGEIVGRRIDVTVTKKGYTPDRVEAKAGEQVTLVFTRTENTECGGEVLVPSLNVRKQLPLNKPVAIPVKADKAGDIGFVCGMDMMRGTLVVL